MVRVAVVVVCCCVVCVLSICCASEASSSTHVGISDIVVRVVFYVDGGIHSILAILVASDLLAATVFPAFPRSPAQRQCGEEGGREGEIRLWQVKNRPDREEIFKRETASDDY